MNDPENFLSRWSRRKREATEDANPAPDQTGPQQTDAAPDVGRAPDAATSEAQATRAKATEPVFDLSTLPPIDSITAETDIRGFFAPGVPAELRLAALRRAWVADPKVRDFIGLADYDWDFHTPGALPGFGPLAMTDELRREVARIVGEWATGSPSVRPETQAATQPAAEPAVSSVQTPPAMEETRGTMEVGQSDQEDRATTQASGTAASDDAVQNQDELNAAQTMRQRSKAPAAARQEQSSKGDLMMPMRRGHGRALPR
jgi:hypothetical protein